MRVALFAVLCLVPSLGAQEKKPKKTPFDAVPGYKVHHLAGFTVVVSDQVLAVDTAAYKKKPLACLELELKNVVGLVNGKCADALRKVPIWAEWDETIALSNGRQGKAYASYYGGNQRNMLTRGMEPLKARCVVVHLTKELTKSYQEKDRPETLLLLHELAHAVHDQLLGMQHDGIRTAYAQAMGRKLYDKSLYIATNEAEFFAEATCAYLDRLEYFPKNRADLKQHDPQTFKLIDSIWGKSATEKAVISKRPPDGRDDFVLDLTAQTIKWGQPLLGSFDPAAAKGRVILMAYVVPEQMAFINRLRGWHDEFEPYGLTLVLTNAGYRRDPAQTLENFKNQNLPFPVLAATFLPAKQSTELISEKPGHAVLFDAAGQCIFRGQTDDATIYLKEAIGRRLAESLNLEEDSLPKPLAAALTALVAGESLASVALKAQPFTTSSDPAYAEPAKALVDAIVEPGVKQLAAATALKKTDPLEAYLQAEAVTQRFKGLAIANKATALMDSLSADKAIVAEKRARRDLEAVLKIETHLASQAGSFEPRDPSFQSRHAASLKQLKDACEAMKKKHPATRATQRATAIAREYGVES